MLKNFRSEKQSKNLRHFLMSYSLQAEGLKGMNIQRLIIVEHGWFSNTVEGAASAPCVVLGLLLRLQKLYVEPLTFIRQLRSN